MVEENSRGSDKLVIGTPELAGAAKVFVMVLLMGMGFGLLVGGASALRGLFGGGFNLSSLMLGVFLLFMGSIFVLAGFSSGRHRRQNGVIFDFFNREVQFLSTSTEPDGLIIPFENLALLHFSKERRRRSSSSGSGSSYYTVYLIYLITREGGEFFIQQFPTLAKLQEVASPLLSQMDIPVMDPEGLSGKVSEPELTRRSAESRFSAASEGQASKGRAVVTEPEGAYEAVTLKKGKTSLVGRIILVLVMALFLGAPLLIVAVPIIQGGLGFELIFLLPFALIFEVIAGGIFLYNLKSYRILLKGKTVEILLAFPGPLGVLNQKLSIPVAEITHFRLGRSESMYTLVMGLSERVELPGAGKLLARLGAFSGRKAARRLFPDEQAVTLWEVPIWGGSPSSPTVFDLLALEERLQSRLGIAEELVGGEE